MALRPCLDCHVLTDRPRCASCRRAHDRMTGRDHGGLSASARGYGREHREQRASYAADVATGRMACARCGDLIKAGEPWDLGHTDDRTDWTGPEHARCNRAAPRLRAVAAGRGA